MIWGVTVSNINKIYVLNGGCIDDYYVVAVFSSEEKAYAAREKIIKVDCYYKNSPNDLWVQEFELNKLKDYGGTVV